MNSLLTAPAIMTGIGLFFGTVLAVAHRLLHVDEDPRIEATNDMLPGTNCGACGQPGCLPFAEKLVAGEVEPGQCTVSTDETIEMIAEFLEVDAGRAEKLVARLRCAGGHRQAHQIAEYRGFEGCRAAAVVSGGGKGCAWGCLGLADCERACTFDAIHMNANGLPQVDTVKCRACPDCMAACPRDRATAVRDGLRRLRTLRSRRGAGPDSHGRQPADRGLRGGWPRRARRHIPLPH
jgi:Na+-translocating ferredoxin:NAD+ oxidoreductase RNF subunit RnfB